MKLIDKDSIIAEIERKIKKYATIDVGDNGELEALFGAKCHVLMSVLSFIDTLEVREVEEPYVMGKTGKFTTTTK